MSFPQVLTGVAHIGIPTNDLDKTIAFYKKLGFVSALETVNKAAGERVAFLQLGDLMIETYENHRAAEKAGAIDHVSGNDRYRSRLCCGKRGRDAPAAFQHPVTAVLGKRCSLFHGRRPE